MSEIKIEELVVQHQMNFLKNLEVVLSGFIHDLNNPLSVIAGQSSILKTLVEMDKVTNEKALKCATKVLSSTERMGVMIQLLRDFYKPSSVDNSKGNIKLSLDTIYNLSIPKIFRNDLKVEANLFDKTCYSPGLPLIFNLLFWNIHYIFLDNLELNPQQLLKIDCSQGPGKVSICYSLANGKLDDKFQNSSECLVAKAFTEKLGGKLTCSPKQFDLQLSIID